SSMGPDTWSERGGSSRSIVRSSSPMGWPPGGGAGRSRGRHQHPVSGGGKLVSGRQVGGPPQLPGGHTEPPARRVAERGLLGETDQVGDLGEGQVAGRDEPVRAI